MILWIIFNFFNVYLFSWMIERAQVGEGKREGDRIWSRLQAQSCQHRAWCRARTHGPRDHVLSQSRTLNRLSHPGAPDFVLFNFFFQRLFIFGTERDRAWTGEGQRERETESETGSRLWAISPEPDTGLELMDHEIMTWAEVSGLTDWATQAPQIFFSL